VEWCVWFSLIQFLDAVLLCIHFALALAGRRHCSVLDYSRLECVRLCPTDLSAVTDAIVI
jgi:hypothetical protein